MGRQAPIAIDLFCGLGGWTDGLLNAGYDVTGYDIEAHEYGDMRYPAKLVLRDVLDIHGSEFKDAALIVASPPCQEYSYMAMPWSIAKAKAAAIRADATGKDLERLNRLFNACFRIQREACAAAGRHIPLVVENVRGAQPWVGRARWNFGSFYLWGDVPALMPTAIKGEHVKAPGMNWSDPSKRGQDFTRLAGKYAMTGVKVPSQQGRRTDPGKGARFTSRDCGVEALHTVSDDSGTKIGGDWFSDPNSTCRKHGSKSKARKAASAMIAKIPLPLSSYIARHYLPLRDTSIHTSHPSHSEGRAA